VTKVLNLDALETTVERVIVLKGVEYKMKPFTVEGFVNQMKEIEEIGDREPSGSEVYATSVKMIQRAFPDLTDEVLNGLYTHQVDAIFAFLKDRSSEAIQEAQDSGN
jgi:hypothetical protein